MVGGVLPPELGGRWGRLLRDKPGKAVRAIAVKTTKQPKAGKVLLNIILTIHLNYSIARQLAAEMLLFRDIAIFQTVSPADGEHPDRSPWCDGSHVGRCQIHKDRHGA